MHKLHKILVKVIIFSLIVSIIPFGLVLADEEDFDEEEQYSDEYSDENSEDENSENENSENGSNEEQGSRLNIKEAEKKALEDGRLSSKEQFREIVTKLVTKNIKYNDTSLLETLSEDFQVFFAPTVTEKQIKVDISNSKSTTGFNTIDQVDSAKDFKLSGEYVDLLYEGKLVKNSIALAIMKALYIEDPTSKKRHINLDNLGNLVDHDGVVLVPFYMTGMMVYDEVEDVQEILDEITFGDEIVSFFTHDLIVGKTIKSLTGTGETRKKVEGLKAGARLKAVKEVTSASNVEILSRLGLKSASDMNIFSTEWKHDINFSYINKDNKFHFGYGKVDVVYNTLDVHSDNDATINFIVDNMYDIVLEYNSKYMDLVEKHIDEGYRLAASMKPNAYGDVSVIGDLKTEYEILKDNALNNIISALDSIVNGGAGRIIYLSLGFFFIQIYEKMFIDFSGNFLFYTHGAEHSWFMGFIDPLIVPILFVGLLILIVYFIGDTYYNGWDYKKHLRKLGVFLTAIMLPLMGYNLTVELLFNKPVNAIASSEMKRMTLMDRWNKNAEDLHEEVKDQSFFLGEEKFRDNNYKYILKLSAQESVGGNSSLSHIYSILEPEERNVHIYNEDIKEEKIKIYVDVMHIFDWLKDGQGTPLFEYLDENYNYGDDAQYLGIEKYTEYGSMILQFRDAEIDVNTDLYSFSYLLSELNKAITLDTIKHVLKLHQYLYSGDRVTVGSYTVDGEDIPIVREVSLFPSEIEAVKNLFSSLPDSTKKLPIRKDILENPDVFDNTAMEELLENIGFGDILGVANLVKDIFDLTQEDPLLDYYVTEINLSVLEKMDKYYFPIFEVMNADRYGVKILTFFDSLREIIILETAFELVSSIKNPHLPVSLESSRIEADSFLRSMYMPYAYLAPLEDRSENLAVFLVRATDLGTLIVTSIAFTLLALFAMAKTVLVSEILLPVIMGYFFVVYVLRSDYKSKTWAGVTMILLSLAVSKLSLLLLWKFISSNVNESYYNASLVTGGVAKLNPMTTSLAIILVMILIFKYIVKPVTKAVLDNKADLGGQFFLTKTKDVVDRIKNSFGDATDKNRDITDSSSESKSKKNEGSSVKNILDRTGDAKVGEYDKPTKVADNTGEDSSQPEEEVKESGVKFTQNMRVNQLRDEIEKLTAKKFHSKDKKEREMLDSQIRIKQKEMDNLINFNSNVDKEKEQEQFRRDNNMLFNKVGEEIDQNKVKSTIIRGKNEYKNDLIADILRSKGYKAEIRDGKVISDVSLYEYNNMEKEIKSRFDKEKSNIEKFSPQENYSVAGSHVSKNDKGEEIISVDQNAITTRTVEALKKSSKIKDVTVKDGKIQFKSAKQDVKASDLAKTFDTLADAYNEDAEDGVRIDRSLRTKLTGTQTVIKAVNNSGLLENKDYVKIGEDYISKTEKAYNEFKNIGKDIERNKKDLLKNFSKDGKTSEVLLDKSDTNNFKSETSKFIRIDRSQVEESEFVKMFNKAIERDIELLQIEGLKELEEQFSEVISQGVLGVTLDSGKLKFEVDKDLSKEEVGKTLDIVTEMHRVKTAHDEKVAREEEERRRRERAKSGRAGIHAERP